MSRRGTGLAILAASLVASALPIAYAADERPEAAPSYPLTIRNVWYRNAKRSGFTGAKHSGDLTIDRRSLEFFAKKRSLSIPLENLWMVSYGTMRGDVDTEWVVLTIKEGEERTLVGLRDGSRWGFGRRTRTIYETLIRAAEDLSAGQFAVPAGFEPYTEMDHVFAMPIPVGWSSYHHDLVSHEGKLRWGTVVFSATSLVDDAERTTGQSTTSNPARKRALRELQQGKATAWIVGRFAATAGLDCDELKGKGLAGLGRRIAQDPFFGVPFTLPDDPPFEPSEPIDGCAAARIVLRAPADDGRTALLDLRAASREGTLLLIGLRTTAEAYDRERAAFEQAVSQLRFVATR